MVRTGIKTDAANIHNNEIASFYRLWKRDCYTNPAVIAISVELSGLKGKIASALEKNQKSAPIAIGVEVRSALETEGADRDRCGVLIATLRLSAPRGRKLRRNNPR